MGHKAISIKINEFYNALIDVVEEDNIGEHLSNLVILIFRYMKQGIREPHFLCKGIDQGNVCPTGPLRVDSIHYYKDQVK